MKFATKPIRHYSCPLNYQVRGQCWSLIKRSNRSQKHPEVKDGLKSIWSASPKKATDYTVGLQQVTAGMCASQHWTFWTHT